MCGRERERERVQKYMSLGVCSILFVIHFFQHLLWACVRDRKNIISLILKIDSWKQWPFFPALFIFRIHTYNMNKKMYKKTTGIKDLVNSFDKVWQLEKQKFYDWYSIIMYSSRRYSILYHSFSRIFQHCSLFSGLKFFILEKNHFYTQHSTKWFGKSHSMWPHLHIE